MQNFKPGENGKCDPAAVRCNERIARWYILIDHQLSDDDGYSDRITGQKQQNGQELSRAMTTLNDLYDDPQGRYKIDVLSKSPNHGCQQLDISGATPTDYNGGKIKVISDNNDAANRLLGNPNPSLVSNCGTAEPEMRALYILLIMNQPLEVNTYLVALCKRNPPVYDSRPVQLAMKVYQNYSKDNYAGYFNILKDPETPYLFACMMFTHVEHVRRVGAKSMNSSFGYRPRSSVGKNDSMPIKELVNLMCFEVSTER